MNYDSEVLISFGWYYGWSILLWSAAVAGSCFVIKKRRKAARRDGAKPIMVAVGTAVLIWCAYFAVTAKWTLTRIALDAEDPVTAEWAYRELFSVNLNMAIRLAVDDREWETVRFYAACRAGELLANTTDRHALNDVLQRVQRAPMIQPCFFGTNAINCDLFTNGVAGPYRVGEIIGGKYHRFAAKMSLLPR